MSLNPYGEALLDEPALTAAADKSITAKVVPDLKSRRQPICVAITLSVRGSVYVEVSKN